MNRKDDADDCKSDFKALNSQHQKRVLLVEAVLKEYNPDELAHADLFRRYLESLDDMDNQ